MGKYDGATVEIINWDKFNPRKDLKASSWFRLQNTLFEDHNFFEWCHSEILFWVYILSLASKKQSGKIRFAESHAERIGRFKIKDIESTFEKLVELQCVQITFTVRDVDVTCATRGRDVDVTLRTNERDERNERDETDAATSASPMLAQELFTESTQEILEKTKPEAQKAWLATYSDSAWIKLELAKAWAWCKSNPSKAPKSDWTRFVNGWLSRGWENHRKNLPSSGPQNYAQKREQANQASLSEYLDRIGGSDEQAS